jgi:hypothetical protein
VQGSGFRVDGLERGGSRGVPFFLALVVDGVYSLHPYLVHRLQEVPHFRLQVWGVGVRV